MGQAFGYTDMKVSNFKYGWTISDFKFCPSEPGKALTSPSFVINDADYTEWCLQLYPGGVDGEGDHMSVFLELLSPKETGTMTELKMSVEGSNTSHGMKSLMCSFTRDRQVHGFRKFIARDRIMDEGSGLLTFGKLIINCEINVNTGMLNHPDNISVDKSLNSNAWLVDDFSKFFTSKVLSDVKLTIGDRSYLAHKAILAARSSRFQEMFLRHKLCSEFEIENIQEDIMDNVLEFLYTAKINVTNYSEAKDFLHAAVAYHFADLEVQLRCQDELLKNLSPDNAAELLIFAEDNQFVNLEITMINYIITHANAVAKSEGYKAMVKSHPQLVERLFRSFFLSSEENDVSLVDNNNSIAKISN